MVAFDCPHQLKVRREGDDRGRALVTLPAIKSGTPLSPRRIRDRAAAGGRNPKGRHTLGQVRRCRPGRFPTAFTGSGLGACKLQPKGPSRPLQSAFDSDVIPYSRIFPVRKPKVGGLLRTEFFELLQVSAQNKAGQNLTDTIVRVRVVRSLDEIKPNASTDLSGHSLPLGLAPMEDRPLLQLGAPWSVSQTKPARLDFD